MSMSKSAIDNHISPDRSSISNKRDRKFSTRLRALSSTQSPASSSTGQIWPNTTAPWNWNKSDSPSQHQDKSSQVDLESQAQALDLLAKTRFSRGSCTTPPRRRTVSEKPETKTTRAILSPSGSQSPRLFLSLGRSKSKTPNTAPSLASQASSNHSLLSFVTLPKILHFRSPSAKTSDVQNSPACSSHSHLPETEGNIFQTTIEKAAGRAGKNGIPDVVIQCVEYLERMNLLDTEGLYRVPGSVKRVKMWCALFERAMPLAPTDSPANASNLTQLHNGRRTSGGEWESKKDSFDGSEISQFNSLAATASSRSEAYLPSLNQRSTKTHLDGCLCNEQNILRVGLWGGDPLGGTIGFPVSFNDETAPTVASILKKYLSLVQGGFVPSQFWSHLDMIAIERNGQPPIDITIRDIQNHIQAYLPSRHHIHTFAYVILHLYRVHTQSTKNMMTAKNLVICIFISGKEGAEYIIKYANKIFGSVDLLGRDTTTSLPKAPSVQGEQSPPVSPDQESPCLLQSSSMITPQSHIDSWFSDIAHSANQLRQQKIKPENLELLTPLCMTQPARRTLSLISARHGSLDSPSVDCTVGPDE